jgi:hypothetical protein
MTWFVVLSSITAVMSGAAWVIVSLKRLEVSDARTKQALTGCPAENRAAVLEAAGKYARCLNGERQENLILRRFRNGRTATGPSEGHSHNELAS